MNAGRFNLTGVNSTAYHAYLILQNLSSEKDAVIDGDTGVVYIRALLEMYLELVNVYSSRSYLKHTKQDFKVWLEKHLKDPLSKEAMLFTHQSLERTSKTAAPRYGL